MFLVDDEPSFTELMGSLLEQGTGLPVRTFTSPLQALEALTAANPSVIITDLVMPRMNGFEFMREVSKLHPDVPCILITGNHLDSESIERIRVPRLVGVLFKPLSWRAIAALIREHVPAAA